MANFRWAYIDCTSSGTTGSGSAGPANSLQFVTESGGGTTGSAFLTFQTASRQMYLTGNLYIPAAYNISGAGYSGSGKFHNVGAATFESTIAATGSINCTSLTASTGYSGSGRFHTVGAATFESTIAATSSINCTSLTASTGYSGSGRFHTVGAATFESTIEASSSISGTLLYGDGTNLFSTRYNIITTDYVVSASFDVMGIYTSASVVTASLLDAVSYGPGQRLTFKDIAGSSSTNNIVIAPSSSQMIDSSSTGVKITSDFGSVTILCDGASGFYIIGTN